MKARINSNEIVMIECSRDEAWMLVTALHTHKHGNVDAVVGQEGRTADALMEDAKKAEALADVLEGVL